MPRYSSGWSVAGGQLLSRRFDVAMKHEQHIGILRAVGEVPGLAAALFHTQVLLEVIDGERLHLRKRQQERIFPVVRDVLEAIERCPQRALARPKAMFVDHRRPGAERDLLDSQRDRVRT